MSTDPVAPSREEAILGSSRPVGDNISKVSGPAETRTRDLNVFYGSAHAIKHVTVEIAERQVTALMGPSGCGKSTFLRALNRMHDLTLGARVEGEVILDGENIYAPSTDVVRVRQRVGMVFQRP